MARFGILTWGLFYFGDILPIQMTVTSSVYGSNPQTEEKTVKVLFVLALMDEVKTTP